VLYPFFLFLWQTLCHLSHSASPVLNLHCAPNPTELHTTKSELYFVYIQNMVILPGIGGSYL
jgi:hypothetical protein